MYTAGMPASHSALKQAAASLCRSTITAMSRARSRLAVERRAAGQQRADVGGQVGADVVAQLVDRQVRSTAAAQRRSLHDP